MSIALKVEEKVSGWKITPLNKVVEKELSVHNFNSHQKRE